MPEYPPLTEEEQATLAALQYQQAMADWEAAETARLAELALFDPLAACGDCATVVTALTTIEESDVSDDTKARIGRLKVVLGVDMQALFDRRAALEVANPEPEAPAA